MMKAIITKASDDNYFQPCIISMEKLKKIIELENEIILTFNNWKNEDVKKIMRYWNVTSVALVKWISEADYEIMIYDSYIE